MTFLHWTGQTHPTLVVTHNATLRWYGHQLRQLCHKMEEFVDLSGKTLLILMP